MLLRREFLKMAATGTLSIIVGVGCEDKERDEYKGPKVEFHAHLYLKNYSLDDVIDKAIEKNIKILGLEAYNNDIFPLLLQESKKSKHKIDADSIAISVDDGKLYLPRATEVMTKQGFHVLLLGDYKIKHCENADIEKAIENGFCKNIDIEETIEKGLENDAIVIFDHPFVDASKPWIDVSEEKEKEVEKICLKYGNNILLEWNAYMIKWMRYLSQSFYNSLFPKDARPMECANRKAEELASRLDMRIVADSDVHARNKRLLEAIATAYITTDMSMIDKSSGKKIVSSLNGLIKNKSYENHKEYVSAFHNLEAFVLPVVFGKINKRLAERPRG